MSQENVERVRSMYAAWERGDWSTVEWAHPQIEWVSADGPTPGTWTGLTGMEKDWRDWLSAWGDFRIEVDEYRELDEERVLALVESSGRGKASGLELGQMWAKGAALVHFREGKVTRFVFWWDRARALEALGLRE